MGRRIALIDGHPDPRPERYLRALADAYVEGAREGGHELRRIDVARLDFPLLRGKDDFEHGEVPAAIAEAQAAIGWAEHLVILYPLWLGGMPALLRAFLEQTFRPGFALGDPGGAGMPSKLLAGRSARIVVTMGMPALVYRWYFGAHSLKSLERSILRLCGVRPIKESLIGMVEAKDGTARARWLETMRELGRKGS
jgi:putative NADPH-quinone reductase